MFQFLWAQTGAPGVSEQGTVPAVSDQNATSLDATVPAVSDQNASNLGPEGKLEKRRRIFAQSRQFCRKQIVHALNRHGQTVGLSHLTSEQEQDGTHK